MQWILLLLGGWLAASVSGAAGFGGALLLLPALTYAVGPKAAVPILTLAQLCGNLSRAGFGWREIRWRPALLFSAGAILASILGAELFVKLPPTYVMRVIGVFLLGIVALRRSPFGNRITAPERMLGPAGAVAGFLSAVAGSAGPLGAVVFLSLRLEPQAYIATEAVTATLMHVTKTAIYGKYHLMTLPEFLFGLALGGSMVLGSWTGRRLVARLSERGFSNLVEVLLVLAGLALLRG